MAFHMRGITFGPVRKIRVSSLSTGPYFSRKRRKSWKKDSMEKFVTWSQWVVNSELVHCFCGGDEQADGQIIAVVVKMPR
ncbi:hypothetical protein E2C01_047431 [Portunus trituberculatus]|uniref:Uncharacterized protein n=1 Tax=Portunus trituberculatus TaxID=210409 RepID=A0A5B7G7V9_PORTR|nr:hypothetical protein [Portunus trituberculatus]